MRSVQRFALSLAAVAFALTACARESELQALARAEEQKLEWVERTNATALYAADTQKGVRRFMSVCGYACFAPGVGRMTAERCFPNVTVERIEGTSDVRFSERHSELIQRAVSVAKQYNMLVAEDESKKGHSNCPAGADLDAAFHELGSLFRTTFPMASESAFGMRAREVVFVLVPPDGQVPSSFERTACETLQKHHLPKNTRIAVLSQPDQVVPNRYLCREVDSAT